MKSMKRGTLTPQLWVERYWWLLLPLMGALVVWPLIGSGALSLEVRDFPKVFPLGSRRFVVSVVLGILIFGICGVQQAHSRWWLNTISQALALALLVQVLGYGFQRLWPFLAPITYFMVFHQLRWIVSWDQIPWETLVLKTGDFSIELLPECSGCESLGLMSPLLLTYLYLSRERLRFPRAWVLLPVGLVLTFVGNSLRISLLVLIGRFVSPTLALMGFHQQGGWLFVVFSGASFLLIAERTQFFLKPRALALSEDDDDESVPLIVPMLVMIAVMFCTGSFTNQDYWFYPARVFSFSAVVWLWRKDYQRILRGFPTVGTVLGGALLAVIWHWMQEGGKPHSEMIFSHLPWGWRELWLGLRLVGYVICAPVAEELFFRRYLLERIGGGEGAHGVRNFLGLVTSSLAFGMLHPQWVPGLIAGLCFGGAYLWRRRVSDAIYMHGATNLFLALWGFYIDDWSSWT